MDLLDTGNKAFLDTPNQKRKKYILFLYKENQENQEKIRTLEKTIQKSLKNIILARFEDPNEGLRALIVKNIEMLILDSSLFEDDSIAIDYVVECKKRKKCPVFFIAKDSVKIVEEYRKKLYMYEEFDNYFPEPVDTTDLSKKLQQALVAKGRTAKRFLMSVPVSFYRLNDNRKYTVNLIDLSLVGFGVEHNFKDLFVKNEQVQIKIPLEKFKLFHAQYGEFLPLSGRLRRVDITGNVLGFSIEFITPMQMETLCHVLSVIHFVEKAPKRPGEATDTLSMSDVL